MSEITQAISRKLDQQGIVIWHDPDQDFLEDFNQLELPDNTQKLHVDNNEFGIKHTVFTAPEGQKFLIYRPGPATQDTDNWLLDLELAYGTFTADRASLALNAADIRSPIAASLAAHHPAFFSDSALLDQLKTRLTNQEDEATFKAKMTACILGLPEDQHSMQAVLSALLVSYADGTPEPEDVLAPYDLKEFFWQGARAIYAYPEEATENFGAFLIWAYRDEVLNSTAPEYRNIRTDYKAFRDNYHTRQDALTIARIVAENTNYRQAHQDDTLDDLLASTRFEETEQLILLHLAQAVSNSLYSAQEISDMVTQREQNSVLWYTKYENSYRALRAGAQFLETIKRFELGSGNLNETFQTYITSWYTIDQLYRTFHLAQKQSNQDHGNSMFKALTQQINQAYTSNYLLPLGNRWSELIDATPRWRQTFRTSNLQENFYTEHVQRETEKARTCVIISDGLRYEVAQELERKLAHNKKYDTRISAMLGVLPSYTQLGMASLLPPAPLAINSSSSTVSAGGILTSGTENRDKILRQYEGLAVRYQDIVSLSQTEIQEKFKDHKFIYIYHNTIDNIGDKRATENETFTAAERAKKEIKALIKKLHRSVTRILITADHGFIYQDEEDNQVSYLSEKAHGDSLGFVDRRFVLGTGLSRSDSFHHFTSEELGLTGDTEILIPRSIQRLKKQGSGFKYVHGGASLQELTVPVINVRVTKKKNTAQTVRVGFAEVPQRMTTNLLTIKLLQQEPVGELKPLKLRAGIYHADKLISDQPEATFNLTAEMLSERQVKLTLELTRAADGLPAGPADIRLESYNTTTDTWQHYDKTSIEIKRGNTEIDDFFN